MCELTPRLMSDLCASEAWLKATRDNLSDRITDFHKALRLRESLPSLFGGLERLEAFDVIGRFKQPGEVGGPQTEGAGPCDEPIRYGRSGVKLNTTTCSRPARSSAGPGSGGRPEMRQSREARATYRQRPEGQGGRGGLISGAGGSGPRSRQPRRR
jgi:hypothetical protein